MESDQEIICKIAIAQILTFYAVSVYLKHSQFYTQLTLEQIFIHYRFGDDYLLCSWYPLFFPSLFCCFLILSSIHHQFFLGINTLIHFMQNKVNIKLFINEM